MFQLLQEQTERYHSSSKLFNGVPVRLISTLMPWTPFCRLHVDFSSRVIDQREHEPLLPPVSPVGSEQPPPPSYVPPPGASPMTWPNIYKNLKRIDYCVDQFDHVRSGTRNQQTRASCD